MTVCLVKYNYLYLSQYLLLVWSWLFYKWLMSLYEPCTRIQASRTLFTWTLIHYNIWSHHVEKLSENYLTDVDVLKWFCASLINNVGALCKISVIDNPISMLIQIIKYPVFLYLFFSKMYGKLISRLLYYLYNYISYFQRQLSKHQTFFFSIPFISL